MADNKIIDDYYSQIEKKKEEKPKATIEKVVAKKKIVLKKAEKGIELDSESISEQSLA
ncbi:MAG: hypothetical protein LBQ59_02450 [Candidatus Peribacteria bacterium]|jgi:hypothetical protein|nr:hypothetical protein [Candidatus Peribacteria bacterium]